MKVTVAEKNGFCYGVKRAIALAKNSSRNRDRPVYTLGPIIHNRQVVDDLKMSGVEPIEELSDAMQGSRVIIRSHGVPPEIYSEAGHKNIEIVDATCPFVVKAQRIAQDLAQKDIKVIIVGDANHPEVKGVMGWAEGRALVLGSPEEVCKHCLPDRVGVLAQTTQTRENFNAVVDELKKVCREVAVYNTICNATEERQRSAVELARRAEVMVVVGGRESSNTAKLAALCAAVTGNPFTHQVESAEELQREWFREKEKAGLTAGASTPQWIIEEVERRMKELGGMTANEHEIIEQEKAIENGAPAEAETVFAEAPAKEEDMVNAMDIKSVLPGEIVTGVVVQVNQDEVLVDVGAKSEGVISLRELSCCDVPSPHDIVKVGDKIEVFVLKTEDKEGRLILSKEKADAEKYWSVLEDRLESGEAVSGTVREVVKGGLLVDVGVRAFLPASLVERGYVEDLNKFLGEKIFTKVVELNRPRKKVILSRKALLEEEYAKKREEMFGTLQVKQVLRGTVRRLTNFGAFVDIGGVDGLLHISEMAWYRINHPSEVVKVGDELDVMVLKIDQGNEKISLGLKQVVDNPWNNVEEKYPVGRIVAAKVVRLAPFGAFVQLEPGIEGLIHISHLADRHVERPDEVVKEGEEVTVKVLRVDPQEKRIRLSIREVNREKEREPRPPRQQEALPQMHESGEGGSITIGDLVGDIFEQK